MTQATHNSQRYRDSTVALLTKHHKAPVIAPALDVLRLSVISTDAFDTDTLGMFSGEVQRTLSPIECARQKAKLACELTGAPLGLGSEGSFGGGPMPGLLNWDDEILLLYDAESSTEIVAFAAGPVRLKPIQFSSLAELDERLRAHNEEQAWMLHHQDDVFKGLTGVAAISALLAKLKLMSHDQLTHPLTLEPDLRAMHCPERREYIRQAAEQLAQRLQSLCPSCAAPDFWQHAVERGLPCRWCGEPTERVKAMIKQCPQCQHAERESVADEFADPGECQWCNP